VDDALLDRHSTRVRMTLLVDGVSYEVAQVGPDYLIFREPVQLSPCEGLLSIAIDGNERLRTVRLTDGAQPCSRIVPTTSV
jgi:hypothetical protein